MNIHFHSTVRPVPGSCRGNGFYTFCPCPLLWASEQRHRWRRGSAGSWSVSQAWAAGTGLEPRLSNVTQGLAAAVRMPWGGGSRSQGRSYGALANPPRGGEARRAGGKGPWWGGDGAASVYPCGESCSGTRLCWGMGGRGEGGVPVPRNWHGPEGQAHMSPTPTQTREQSWEPWEAPGRTWVMPGRLGRIWIGPQGRGSHQGKRIA